MEQILKTMLENVRAKTPLVHNITNYVTVNDVANVLLAAGGSPIMSDDADDVEDRTKPPACQGGNVKSSPLCGTGTLHGCGFRLYTRCVKQKRELVSAKILNVTGGRDEPFQTHRVPPAAARAFSHLLLYFGCNRGAGMIQLRCRGVAVLT